MPRWSDFYRRRLLSYDVHLEAYYLRQFMGRVLHLARGGRALEVGVGTGYLSIHLSRQGVEAVGIDLDEDIVDQAILANAVLGGGARFGVGDAFELSRLLNGQRFNVIFHQGLLEHFSDEDIRRLLEEQIAIGDYVLFSVPSKYYPQIDFGNERLMDIADWKRILGPLASRLTAVEYHGHTPAGREHIFMALRGLAAEEKTASPSAEPVSDAPPCRWMSHIFHPSGYAAIARSTLLGLSQLGHSVSLEPMSSASNISFDLPTLHTLLHLVENKPQFGSVFVYHHPPADHEGKNLCAIMRAQNPGMIRYVSSTMFETDRIPLPWVDASNSMDEVWVPTQFNEETYTRSGVDPGKIRRIPFGVDPRLFTASNITPARFPGGRKFNFLSVFEWTKRKGWDVLLKAYLSEFSQREDVALNLVVYRGSGTNHKQTAVEQAANFVAAHFGVSFDKLPAVHFIESVFPYYQMPSVYAGADAFVLPSRGEGWGMPYMEAMAMGLPVIGTRWSGNLEFMNDRNSFLVDIDRLSPVDSEQVADNPYYAGHQWAEPSDEHLRQLMRRVFSQRDNARAIGQQARQDILSRYTTTAVAEIVIRRLSEIGREARQYPAAKPSSTDSDRSPRGTLPTVLWRAPIYDPSGYADEARHFLGGLGRQGIDVAARAVGRHSDAFRSQLDGPTRRHLDEMLARPAPPERINVLHFPAYAFERDPQAACNIGRVMFESDGLPADWVAKCNEMDEVWVPTDFNLETFRQAGVTAQLFKVPGGIDTKRFRPGIKPLRIPGARGAVFLSIFEWSRRKGWDVLLRAWAEAFGPDDGVSLVLRTYPLNAADSPDAAAEIENRISRFLQEALGKSREQVAPIVVLGEQISEARLPRLFAAAHAYVAPSRGEGWGRPHMQAMACGLPVIATRWSGNLEFMTDENSCLIDIEGLETIDGRAEIPLYRGQRWAEPSASHLAALLRRIREHPSEAKAIGERARRDMVERWGWGKAATIAAERLRAIWEEKTPAVSETLSAPHISIRWEGSQFVHHSLALINREMCIRLAQEKDVAISIIPSERHQFGPEADPRFAHIARRLNQPLPRPADVHVRHQWPPNFTPPPEGHWIMVQPWEFGSIPKKWIEVMRAHVDEVWAYTTFVRDCYVQSGLPADRVRVVPPAVDVDRFRPGAPPLKLKTDKRFKFLFVGGTIWRKGPDVLLDAYLNSFTAADDVCLVIKDMGGSSFYKGMTFGDQIRRIQSDPNAPEILYLVDDMAPADLPGLYTACDCLVHPYRGEGFGLPIAEAMACGLPVVVTGAGACLDFCDETTAYLIPAQKQYLAEKRIGEWETVDLPFTCEPDRGAAARLMRRVFENPDEARALGARASQRIRATFTWEGSASHALERIRALRERPIRREAAARVEAAAVRGQSAIAAGRWDEAADVFENILREHPDLADAHAALGSICLVRGEPQRAVQYLARAAELSPDDAALRNQLGVANFQNGDADSAESQFQRTLSIDPGNVDAILNLVEVCRAQGRYPEAAGHVKHAIEIAPHNPDALTAFGRLGLELGDADAARVALDNLRRVAPDHPSVQLLEESLVTP